MVAIDLAERGWLPDAVVRSGIRRLLRRRLRELGPLEGADAEAAERTFARERCAGAIAPGPAQANTQHYELPAAFFERVLGPHCKYSCALWEDGAAELGAAEAAMLATTCARAGIEDGMSVLDLGCGWGALSLWIAERHPYCHVVALSHSKGQREHIVARCAERGLDNVEVRTADVNLFSPGRRFDRVVSVEMFEHLRNHALLLSRIAAWLAPEGRLFVHHFSHRTRSYPYATAGEDDWMGRHFFSDGMMPSHDLLRRCQDDLEVEAQWRVGGLHYRKTCQAWLARQDAQAEALRPILAQAYGANAVALWHRRWRLFFLACAELFGYRRGEEWGVTHVRMAPRGGRP